MDLLPRDLEQDDGGQECRGWQVPNLLVREVAAVKEMVHQSASAVRSVQNHHRVTEAVEYMEFRRG